jgi:hypothetical protein
MFVKNDMILKAHMAQTRVEDKSNSGIVLVRETKKDATMGTFVPFWKLLCVLEGSFEDVNRAAEDTGTTKVSVIAYDDAG